MNAVNVTQPIRRRAGSIRWPLIIVGLLLGHMSLMGVAVTLATRVGRDGVVPDYYQKAVNWDRDRVPPATANDEARP